MKTEIREQRKNPLMKREEVVFSVEHDGKATPSRADLLREVSKKLKVKEELVIIDRIFTARGKSQSSLKALVYKKAEDIPEGKREKMKARMERKKAKPSEEPKPAEKKEAGEGEKAGEAKEEPEGEAGEEQG